MGWWETVRERNETAGERIARHPFVSWAGHAALFASFALILQLLRSGPVDWNRAGLLGVIVATGVVGGTLVGHHVRRSRQR